MHETREFIAEDADGLIRAASSTGRSVMVEIRAESGQEAVHRPQAMQRDSTILTFILD